MQETADAPPPEGLEKVRLVLGQEVVQLQQACARFVSADRKSLPPWLAVTELPGERVYEASSVRSPGGIAGAHDAPVASALGPRWTLGVAAESLPQSHDRGAPDHSCAA